MPGLRSSRRLQRTTGDFVRVAPDGIRPGYGTCTPCRRDRGRRRQEGDHGDADRRPDLRRRDRPRRDLALVTPPPRSRALSREQRLYGQVEIHTIAGAAAVAVSADRRPAVALEQAVEAPRRRPWRIG